LANFEADERTATLIDSAILWGPVNRACFDQAQPARKLVARQIRDWIGEIREHGSITTIGGDSPGNQDWPDSVLPWISMALDEAPAAALLLPLSRLSPRQFLSTCGPEDLPILEHAAALVETPQYGPKGSEGREILLSRLFDIWTAWKASPPTICGDDTRDTDIRRLVDYACREAGFSPPSIATLNRRIRHYRGTRRPHVD